MNTKFTVDNLATWISDLIYAVKADTPMAIAYFEGTSDKPICLVAGWEKLFNNNDFSDTFCLSVSKPGYVMSVKIVPNGAIDFAHTEEVISPNGEADDTCFPLEWDDIPEYAAEFFTHEWERLMKEHNEEI